MANNWTMELSPLLEDVPDLDFDSLGFSPESSPETPTMELYDENTGVYWLPMDINTTEPGIDPNLLTMPDTSAVPLDPAIASLWDVGMVEDGMVANNIDPALMDIDINPLQHQLGMNFNGDLELGLDPYDQSISDPMLDPVVINAPAAELNVTVPSPPPTIYPSPFDDPAESSLYNPAHTNALLAPPTRSPPSPPLPPAIPWSTHPSLSQSDPANSTNPPLAPTSAPQPHLIANRYPDTVVRGPPPPLIPASNGRGFIKEGKRKYYQPMPEVPAYMSTGFTAELTEEARQRIDERTLERQMEKRKKALKARKPASMKRSQIVSKPKREIRQPLPVFKRGGSGPGSELSNLSNVFSNSGDVQSDSESGSEYEGFKCHGSAPVTKDKGITRRTVSGRVNKGKRVVRKAKMPKGLEIEMIW
ncbi:MAG: hypothetical protein Q9202_000770 [Teloschistes flavicans]